jgi:hypothetical protein
MLRKCHHGQKMAHFIMIVDMAQQVVLGSLSPQAILMNWQFSALKVKNPHV